MARSDSLCNIAGLEQISYESAWLYEKNIQLIIKHLALTTNTVFNCESEVEELNLKTWILKFQFKNSVSYVNDS